MMTREEIEKELELHKLWLEGKKGGVKIVWHHMCFHRSNFRNAVLRGADLFFCNFSESDLSGADLRGANLRYADLSYSNLRDADLHYSNLYGALCRGIMNMPYIPTNLPEGEFTAYKKIKDCESNEYIVKLKILAISKRSRATSDKCRCDMALVEEIQDMAGNKLSVSEVEHYGFKHLTYKVGEIVKADQWNENRFVECTHGIHFFIDRQSAVNYVLT